MSRTQRSCATALLVLLLCSLIGCSAPRLPCSLLRSCPAPFVPGPSQSSSTETAAATPSAGHGPGRQLALRGNLNAEAGLTATVLTRLGLDSVTKVSRPAGTIRLQLPVHGSVSVTNSAAGFNAAAVSVDFEIRAGYRRTSTVCRKLAPHAPAHATYCWPIIATATPRAADDAVPPLSKGQSRSLKISGTPGQVTVPKADATRPVPLQGWLHIDGSCAGCARDFGTGRRG